MKFKPHKYQEKAIGFFLERACAGAFLEPGMGKTSITLAALTVLKQQGMIDKILILAPLRVCYSVWPLEVMKWDEFRHFSVGVLHGPDKDKVLKSDFDIYVMNYEGLSWLKTKTEFNGAFPFDVLIVDEVSKMKHTNTQRFKILKSMLGKFKRRYILTGTPAANSLLDLFGQIYCMDMGASFGPYVGQYKQKYFQQTGFGGYEWRLKPGSDVEIHEVIAPRVMRLAAADYLELPPLIEVDIKVTLPVDVMKQYKQMENALRLDIESNKIVAANTGVATMKCRQIANGGIYIDAGCNEAQHLHDAKTEAVLDLIEELEGQPVLIAYDFKHDLERLKLALGKDTPHIGGGVSAKRSAEIVTAWNNGEIPVLLGHPQSMSHGLNMQGAGRAVIWHSLTWSLENRLQFIQRIWRQGQKNPVFVYNIIAEKTVDEALMRAVKLKDKGQTALMDALKEYWKEH